jgi:hypothetical protein
MRSASSFMSSSLNALVVDTPEVRAGNDIAAYLTEKQSLFSSASNEFSKYKRS